MMLSFLSRIFSKKTPKTGEVKPAIYTRQLIGNKPFIKSIGEFTYGNPKIYHWGENAQLTIGNYCSIAEGVVLMLGGNHRTDWITTYPFGAIPTEWNTEIPVGHPATKGNITIGNDVWIATGALILSGVTVGDGAVIGAHAVVTKDVEPYAIVAGNPATFIKKRFSDPIIKDLISIAWWTWDKEKVTANISLLCQPDVQDFIDLHKKTDK